MLPGFCRRPRCVAKTRSSAFNEASLTDWSVFCQGHGLLKIIQFPQTGKDDGLGSAVRRPLDISMIDVGQTHDRHEMNQFGRPDEVHHRFSIKGPVFRIDNDKIEARIAEAFHFRHIPHTDKGTNGSFVSPCQITQNDSKTQ